MISSSIKFLDQIILSLPKKSDTFSPTILSEKDQERKLHVELSLRTKLSKLLLAQYQLVVS